MKRYVLLFQLLLIFLISFPTCAPYKMKAIRAQRDQQYDLSIKFALKYLDSNPNDQSVIELLNRAAKGHYDDLQKKIEHFEKLDDWDRVVQVAEQGYRTLSEVIKIVGTDFPTKEQLSYLQSKSEQSKLKQAEALYSEAVRYYGNGDYLEALNQLKTVESYIRHFKDTDKLLADINQKLASQEYQRARDLLSQGNLEEALIGFERTSEYLPSYLDAQYQVNQVKAQLADKYYNEGRTRFDAGDYKNAYHTAQKSLSYQPDYSPAKNLFDEAKALLLAKAYQEAAGFYKKHPTFL